MKHVWWELMIYQFYYQPGITIIFVIIFVFNIFTNFSGYEGFEMCRRKSFHGRLGDKLLIQVQDVLPWDITINSQVKDILMFLAKVKF